ncbi:MAG: NAD(P)H-dependent oxidoreductase subunit E [Dehalococcoidia bacterium]
MDLHLTNDWPTDAEQAAIDAALAGVPLPDNAAQPWASASPLDGDETRARRALLLPALHAVQARVGWISPGAVNYISQRLEAPPAEVFGVASFYALFALEPRSPVVVNVCDDIACLAGGAAGVCAALEAEFGPAGTGSGTGQATWLRSPCLGLCERAPAALVAVAGEKPLERSLGAVDAGAVLAVLAGHDPPAQRTPALPQFGAPDLQLLRRIGQVDPTSLDAYRAAGGYASLRRALAMGQEAVLREVNESRLLGRGGAAFATGRKWEAVAHAAARPHYLVCNADESEPGTFKDRVLMEEDPFALIEAMTIAAYATGCELGYLYIRGEYPLATERLSDAIAQARARGLLGDDILGQGARFDIVLRRGAGAYICGEETALFNSVEGFRGEPRNKPPFPVQAGLFGKPTVVNNVETLVNILPIIRNGGPAYAASGTPDAAGTKLFCISGRVTHPGVYEVPFGITLRGLLTLAGGVKDGRPLQAVLLGGAAGTFLTPDQLDSPLTFAGTRAIGASLGSGVVLVFDDQVDMRAIVRRIAAFFRDESCGQCVPCRVGTVRQDEALARLAAGRPLGTRRGELSLIAEIGQAMRDASICGLGQTASSAIESAIAQLNVFAEDNGT